MTPCTGRPPPGLLMIDTRGRERAARVDARSGSIVAS
ncbi:MAG: hypothetical protein QG671_342 [Actinomycetota bacterium]|jgi:hypothetical protein|nr:hypothetical protein [Actinomycetota bacterium]